MINTLIGLKELRENTKHYIAKVKAGKSFTVLQRSKPIFNITPVDEWGDEGTWETVLDFRDMPGGGMPTDKLIKHMERFEKKHKYGQNTKSSRKI